MHQKIEDYKEIGIWKPIIDEDGITGIIKTILGETLKNIGECTKEIS